MIENYSKYSQLNQTEQSCGICLDNFSLKDDVVSHSGQGHLHPIHRNCAKAWADVNPVCPTCKTAINPESLDSLKEKGIKEMKQASYDAMTGAVVGVGMTALVLGTALAGGLFEDYAASVTESAGDESATIFASGVLSVAGALCGGVASQLIEDKNSLGYLVGVSVITGVGSTLAGVAGLAGGLAGHTSALLESCGVSLGVGTLTGSLGLEVTKDALPEKGIVLAAAAVGGIALVSGLGAGAAILATAATGAVVGGIARKFFSW